jgi:hypothetical protein
VWGVEHKGKIVATTIDPSGDDKSQSYMELEVEEKVKDYKKEYLQMTL